jgi:hypothetical protein
LQKQTNTFNLSFVLPDFLFCLFVLTLYGQHFKSRPIEIEIENFSTVEISLLKLSRLRLSIENMTSQIKTSRPNFKSKRVNLFRKSFN